MGKRSLRRALLVGIAGGVVMASAKSIGAGSGAAAAVSSNLLASLGNSIAANAGAGRRALGQLTVPIAMFRLHLRPYGDDKASLALNAYESGMIAYALTRRDIAIDWGHSARVGTFAFTTQNREIRVDGQPKAGVAFGPIILVSEFALDPIVWRHEAVHTQQQRFLQEVWDVPLETWVRERVPGAGRIPKWINVGVFSPLYFLTEHLIAHGEGPLDALLERDARAFERR